MAIIVKQFYWYISQIIIIIIIIIIRIITTFKDDNIFGRYASLTYGPQLTNIEMLDKMNIQSNIYNGMYNLKILCARQNACELQNPAPLQWVENWLDAIQWLDLSFLRIFYFLLT